MPGGDGWFVAAARHVACRRRLPSLLPLDRVAVERIAQQVLEAFPIESVTVRLQKLLPPIDGTVASAGVEITRRHGS